ASAGAPPANALGASAQQAASTSAAVVLTSKGEDPGIVRDDTGDPERLQPAGEGRIVHRPGKDRNRRATDERARDDRVVERRRRDPGDLAHAGDPRRQHDAERSEPAPDPRREPSPA